METSRANFPKLRTTSVDSESYILPLEGAEMYSDCVDCIEILHEVVIAVCRERRSPLQQCCSTGAQPANVIPGKLQRHILLH